jgi:hypothetical protein
MPFSVDNRSRSLKVVGNDQSLLEPGIAVCAALTNIKQSLNAASYSSVPKMISWTASKDPLSEAGCVDQTACRFYLYTHPIFNQSFRGKKDVEISVISNDLTPKVLSDGKMEQSKKQHTHNHTVIGIPI